MPHKFTSHLERCGLRKGLSYWYILIPKTDTRFTLEMINKKQLLDVSENDIKISLMTHPQFMFPTKELKSKSPSPTN